MKVIEKSGMKIVLVESGHVLVDSVESALDLAMRARYEFGTDRIAVDRRALDEKFFILSTGLAGEILQKYTNYHVKLAIYGDVSKYETKALHDFMYECNHGKDVFWTKTKEEAVERLLEV